MASSSEVLSISFWPCRAVSSAASLSTLARSAPVKPGVRRATLLRSMSGGHRLAAGVDLEDLVAPGEVGGVDPDLSVEAAGTQQRRVEDVGTVGRGDQDHAAADVEAVHLDQQLVEGLLALVVTAAHAGAAVAADGVDLVDEDDRGSVLLGLLEQVADPAGADADEHLDEVGARDGVERHARLAGDGAGEQRLAGARGAVEQHALGDLGAHGLELGGLLQELLDLAELLDRLVAAGDVGERRLRHVLGDQLGLGLGELHDAAATATLHVVHQPQEHQHDQHDREERRQDRADDARPRDLGGVRLDLAGPYLLLDGVLDLGLGVGQPVGHDLVAALALDVLVERGLDDLVAVDERDLRDLAGLDVLDHPGGGDLLVLARRDEVLEGEQDTGHGEDADDPAVQQDALHVFLSGSGAAGPTTLPADGSPHSRRLPQRLPNERGSTPVVTALLRCRGLEARPWPASHLDLRSGLAAPEVEVRAQRASRPRTVAPEVEVRAQRASKPRTVGRARRRQE